MDQRKIDTSQAPAGKTAIEDLSKDELIQKYKSVLNLAKKAKQAKDELAEENRVLKETLLRNETQKEADKKALVTMKETLEQFTEQKLQLSIEVEDLRQRSHSDNDAVERFRIENESLRRRLDSLTNDNESLLNDIDAMENKLKQVNMIGMEQKKHLELLELEVNRLKERECHNASLEQRLNVCIEENKSLKSQEQITKKSLQELSEKYKNLKEINSEQRKKFNSLKDRFVDVYKKLKKVKECKEILLETQHEYADAVSKWQNEIIKASRQLCLQIQSLQAENERLKLGTGNNKNDENTLDVNKISFKLEELKNWTKEALKEHEEQKNMLEEQRKVNENETGKKDLENQQLKQELNDLKLKLENKEELKETQMKKEAQLHEEKEQLQREVAILNEKYENLRVQFDGKIDDNAASQLDVLRSELQSFRQNYELKEREHADLLGEMRELNEALKARGDVISRQQARLQQLETTLNEQDQRLATKNDELQHLNDEMKAAKSRILDEIDSNTNDDSISIASNISRAEELNRLREFDENYEERYNKLRILAVKLKKKLQTQTNDLKQQLQSKENLQKDLEDYKINLEDEKKLNASLQAEMKKLKSSRKQANVLSLEIEAAERSLSEVSSKLNAKSTEINELNAVLQTKESTIVQLRKEISILESAKSSECEHSKELKAQIDLLQSQIKDAVHAKTLALEKSKDVEFASERLQIELEDLRLQLEQSETKHSTAIEHLRTENTQLNSKLQELESTLVTTQSTLNSTQRSLEDMRIEYSEYKVKAQAVLRKNQTKDVTHEQELEDEFTALRVKSQQFESLAKTLRNKLEENEKQLELLKEHNERTVERNNELQRSLEDLRLQNESLLQEQSVLNQNQQKMLRQQREQFESNEICHKEQIKSIESNYQRQIEQLKSELNKSQIRQPIGGNSTKMPSTTNLFNSNLNSNEVLLMKREDAEGSEEANATLSALAAKRKISNASSSRRSLHDFMPLDELLNAPLNDLKSDTILNSNSNTNFENYINANISADSAEHFELLAAKERLQIQESRLRHLTALLAENEQDLAKLTQMNDMLKEELRRQERSVEREQHMHNSEYLKNIFIKFITLNSVDERTRLVPVLNTILKLSRSEMEMLNSVAKGQKVSEQNTRSWSNFLPTWSTGGN